MTPQERYPNKSMRRVPRLLPLAPAVLAALWLLATGPPAAADEALRITSTITYDVKTASGPVRVAWDVTIANHDPATSPSGSGTLSYYYTVNLPVIRGAANASATDENGVPLEVGIEDVEGGVAQRAAVGFADPLYYQETYAFRLLYELPNVRSEGILITPTYAYLPLITAGDESTVIVNTPAGAPWEVTLESAECPQNGNTFTCAGPGGAYVAATVEVTQPAATASTSFSVELQGKTVQIEQTHLAGEEAAAAHQRELIAAALPLIEASYGVTYDGPETVSISQGGRQAVLGYEGLATCAADECEVVLSPVADDYTVVHEITHLWSGIYGRRWLAEGFADLIAHQVIPQLPAGLFQGPIMDRPPANAALQLDDWGSPENIVGAGEEELAIIEAGYDYSLRFLQLLAANHGADTLRKVNQAIAADPSPADSRRFMDLMEGATGADLDEEFLIWVFPDSYRPILATRRNAINRLDELKSRLAAEGLPEAPLDNIRSRIGAWQFDEALAAIDTIEANIDTYAELHAELNTIERDASAAGLAMPTDISDALNRFDFNAARNLIESSRLAVESYRAARSKVEAPRSLWERFGLLGNDPDDALADAKAAFERGQFTPSAELSADAADAIDGASATAFRRLLGAAALMALLAALIAAAFVYTRWRERRLAA